MIEALKYLSIAAFVLFWAGIAAQLIISVLALLGAAKGHRAGVYLMTGCVLALLAFILVALLTFIKEIV